jgi:hypothetical protein
MGKKNKSKQRDADDDWYILPIFPIFLPKDSSAHELVFTLISSSLLNITHPPTNFLPPRLAHSLG